MSFYKYMGGISPPLARACVAFCGLLSLRAAFVLDVRPDRPV